MRSIHLFYTVIFMHLFFSACQQDTIAEVESKTAVVEGFLYAGQAVDSILITQSFSYAQVDTNIQTLDNLEISLSKGDQSFPLFPIGNGYYENSDLLIESEAVYRMDFQWEGETISAETYIPSKKEASLSATEVSLEKIEFTGGGFGGGGFGGPGGGQNIDPIDISWNNSEGDYYYVVINNIEENPEYVNDIIAQLEDENGGRRRFAFISEPQIMDVYSINPQRELSQYGTYQIIIYRVNPEYAALYESSGSTTISLVQPPTNVENGLGILTGVSSDTVYLEVKKI